MTTIASNITFGQFTLYFFSAFGKRLRGLRLINSHYSFTYFLYFIGQELDKFSQRIRVFIEWLRFLFTLFLLGDVVVFFFLPIVFALKSPIIIVWALVFSTIFVEILSWKPLNRLNYFIFILQNLRWYLFHICKYFLQWSRLDWTSWSFFFQ